jgi:hypothetical protein
MDGFGAMSSRAALSGAKGRSPPTHYRHPPYVMPPTTRGWSFKTSGVQVPTAHWFVAVSHQWWHFVVGGLVFESVTKHPIPGPQSTAVEHFPPSMLKPAPLQWVKNRIWPASSVAIWQLVPKSRQPSLLAKLHASLQSLAPLIGSPSGIAQIPDGPQSASVSQNRMHRESEGWPAFVTMHARPGAHVSLEQFPPATTDPAAKHARPPIVSSAHSSLAGQPHCGATNVHGDCEHIGPPALLLEDAATDTVVLLELVVVGPLFPELDEAGVPFWA